jgi:predicted AlkP superfamily phosphohydrolase/phosphomutase
MHVVDLGTHDRMLEPSSAPAGLADELVARHGPHPVVGKCDDYSHDGRWHELVDTLEEAARWRADVALELLGRGEWDLFATVFSESHCVGHQLWWLHDPTWPGHDPALAAELGDGIVRVYEAIDTAVGRILDAIDESTRVAVLMSHGMGAHHDGDHLWKQIVERLDLARGRASKYEQARELALRRARRVVRSVQHQRHPDDPRFRQVTAIDGSRNFFPVPNNELFAALRLNLRGREPRGRVRPGAEADEVLGWLADELGRLHDAETGRPLVRRVLRVDELYTGPRRDQLPDLLVDWERSAPITVAASPTIGEVRGTYSGIRTGDHRPSGQLLLAGPGVPPGQATRAVSSMDVAPTLCAWLGVDLTGVDGRPIPEVLGNAQR